MSATPPEADLVWHYTSGASLLSILQNDVLWASAGAGIVYKAGLKYHFGGS